jgi:hypothetical protein
MIEPIEYLNVMSRQREVKNSKYADDDNVEDVEDGYKSKFHRFYYKHREELLVKKRLYYQQNKEIISAKNKLYRQANAEKIKERQIKWRKENQEKVALLIQKSNEKRRLDRLQKEQHAAQAVFLCLID